MSGYKSHMYGGIILMIIVIHFFYHSFFNPSLIEILWYIIIAIMFALWPDVDIKSKGQKLFYIIFFITDIYLIITGQFKISAFFGLIIILPILSKHRGWTHSYLAMILIPSPILIYPMLSAGSIDLIGFPYYLAAITGYLSHLILDKKSL